MKTNIYLLPAAARVAFCFAVAVPFWFFRANISDYQIFIVRSMAIAAFLLASAESVAMKDNGSDLKALAYRSLGFLSYTCLAGVIAMILCFLEGFDFPYVNIDSLISMLFIVFTIFILNIMLLWIVNMLLQTDHFFLKLILIPVFSIGILSSPIAFFSITKGFRESYLSAFGESAKRVESLAQSISFSFFPKQKKITALSELRVPRKQTLDGWGNQIIYSCDSSSADEVCTITSYGADGKEGGLGVNKDLNAQIKRSEFDPKKMVNFKVDY